MMRFSRSAPWILLLSVLAARPTAAQVPGGRAAAERLRFAPLRFHAPVPETHEVEGVPVLYLEDHTVPLVTMFARFKGGYSLFDRSLYGPASALPALLRAPDQLRRRWGDRLQQPEHAQRTPGRRPGPVVRDAAHPPVRLGTGRGVAGP
jgi:hypothetical protein